MTNLRLYVHPKTIALAARVNMASPTYPLDEITFDTITTGSTGNVWAGMTVLLGSAAGLDDYGRGRVRGVPSSTVLPVGRSSQGTNDGELDVVDNAYLTVINLHQVWAKIPVIDGTTIYKDSDIPAGTNLAEPPPKANGGAGFAGTANSGTGVATVEFDGSASFQFDGALTSALHTVASYLWDVVDGTITVGTSSSAAITATFPPGFRYVHLIVESDAGKRHDHHIPVFVRDAANDVTIAHQVVSHRRTPAGQELSVRVLQDLARADYPDGTLVMLWDDDLQTSDPVRDHMLFCGWEQSNDAGVRVERTANLRDTTLHCVDTLGRLKTLPGFSQVVENPHYEIRITAPASAGATTLSVDGLPTSIPSAYALRVRGTTWSVTTTSSALGGANSLSVSAIADDLTTEDALLYPRPASKWTDTLYPTIFYYLWYLLHWHSTAFDVSDLLTIDQTLIDFQFMILGSDAADLYTQANSLANAVTPDHHLTINRFGQMLLVVDPIIQNVADRTSAVVDTLLETNWTAITWTYNRNPRVYKLVSYAVDSDDGAVVPLAAMAPGLAEGQGAGYIESSERVALGQTFLNATEGNRYARLNARYGMFTITVPYFWLDNDNEPARMEWVTLTFDSDNAPQRELAFSAVRGLVHEINIAYDYQRTGLVRTATLTWEMETSGPAALTYVPPVAEE